MYTYWTCPRDNRIQTQTQTHARIQSHNRLQQATASYNDPFYSRNRFFLYDKSFLEVKNVEKTFRNNKHRSERERRDKKNQTLHNHDAVINSKKKIKFDETQKPVNNKTFGKLPHYTCHHLFASHQSVNPPIHQSPPNVKLSITS